MSHAPAAETALWLVQLTEELGLGPVWEVLIQCMCSPVPQELKAALNAALAALARLPEVAPAILSSLLPAVVPSARPAGAPPALPHYDIGYQLNEVEVRRGLRTGPGRNMRGLGSEIEHGGAMG